MGFPIPDTGAVTEDVGVVGGFLTASGDIDFGPFTNNDAGEWTAETITGSYGSQLVIDDDGVWVYTANNSNAAIQALNTGDTLTEVFTVSSTSGDTTITITINGADEPPCFVAGTLINTPQGPRPVETLRAGDKVLTRDNGVQEIRWAGRRRLALNNGAAGNLQPVRLRKDSLGPGVPEHDLLLSPMHRVLVAGAQVQMLTGATEVLCPVKHLLNGQTIVQEQLEEVHYHHLLFDAHQVLISSGCASESFFPGRVGLGGFEDETRDEVFGIFPELRSLPETYGDTARYVTRRHEGALLKQCFRPVQTFLAGLRERGAKTSPLPMATAFRK
ncbi:MAG: Hint domain-containing protein [Marinosulfonomonas sp.]|nr:Hint domain-containing protein [Marinosulfonomonas sp.]